MGGENANRHAWTDAVDGEEGLEDSKLFGRLKAGQQGAVGGNVEGGKEVYPFTRIGQRAGRDNDVEADAGAFGKNDQAFLTALGNLAAQLGDHRTPTSRSRARAS